VRTLRSISVSAGGGLPPAGNHYLSNRIASEHRSQQSEVVNKKGARPIRATVRIGGTPIVEHTSSERVTSDSCWVKADDTKSGI
jgi:hypothetical protein